MPKPIPRVPPVTTATWPVMSLLMGIDGLPPRGPAPRASQIPAPRTDPNFCAASASANQRKLLLMILIMNILVKVHLAYPGVPLTAGHTGANRDRVGQL